MTLYRGNRSLRVVSQSGDQSAGRACSRSNVARVGPIRWMTDENGKVELSGLRPGVSVQYIVDTRIRQPAGDRAADE